MSFFDVDVHNSDGVSRTQFLARVIFHVRLLFSTAGRLMVTVSPRVVKTRFIARHPG